jgi:hypothetical protein
MLLGHPLEIDADLCQLPGHERDTPTPLLHPAYECALISTFLQTPISSLVAQFPMRQLSLHVSALNDLEYTAYTEALHDLIAGDQPLPDDYDNVSVSAREVRAWLRGRYASMPLSDVDAVCFLFVLRIFSLFHTPSDPRTVLPHLERPGYLQCRAIFCSHAPRYSRKRWEGCLQDPCVCTRYGDTVRCCTVPRPELNSHLT